jgi:hypothetical protein
MRFSTGTWWHERAPIICARAGGGESKNLIQGYVDELSTVHVKGWAWDTARPERRLAITSKQHPLALIADQPSDTLAALGIGDAQYAFSTRFDPALTEDVRRSLTLQADGVAMEFAPNLITTAPTPRFQGYLDALSRLHAAGWLRDVGAPTARFTVEAWLNGVMIASGPADAATPVLTKLGLGACGFHLTFPQLFTATAVARVEIKISGHDHVIERAPALSRDAAVFSRLTVTVIEPAGAMSPSVWARVIPLLAYTTQAGAVLCGAPDVAAHENLPALLAAIPHAYRDRITLRTSLAHRAPPIVFERIAKSMIAAVHVTPPAQPDRFHAEQQRALTAAIARMDPAMRVPTLTRTDPSNMSGPFTAIITPTGEITINGPDNKTIINETIMNETLSDPETLLDRLAD